MNNVLTLDNVGKVYNKHRSFLSSRKEKRALQGVSFDVNANETFGIVGESGSGKTTLAKMIMGILDIDEGDIKVFNQSIAKKPRFFKDQARNIQLIFQDPYGSLNPKKTVGFSVEEALHIHGIGSRHERREAAITMLQSVGLSKDYYNRKPHQLSGGQRQRVAIASALILNPKLVIIDEGVSALDVSVQASILNLLSQLKRERELTLVFISHDLNVIQYFCDRVAVLKHGELQEVFHVDTFDVDEHAPYTMELFNATPQL